jgi:hypothetical protein
MGFQTEAEVRTSVKRDLETDLLRSKRDLLTLEYLRCMRVGSARSLSVQLDSSIFPPDTPAAIISMMYVCESVCVCARAGVWVCGCVGGCVGECECPLPTTPPLHTLTASIHTTTNTLTLSLTLSLALSLSRSLCLSPSLPPSLPPSLSLGIPLYSTKEIESVCYKVPSPMNEAVAIL